MPIQRTAASLGVLALTMPALTMAQEGPVGPTEEAVPDTFDELDALDELDEVDALGGAGGLSGTGAGVELREHRFRAAIEERTYVADREEASQNEQVLVEAELELDVRLGRLARLFVQPRFLIDALDTRLVRYEPLDAYLALEGPHAGVRAGQLVESWGVAEVNNPLDILNRPDLAVDFLDPPRLGELALKASYSSEGGRVVDQPTLSAYVAPLSRSTPLPTAESRWRPAGVSLDVDGDREPSGGDAVLAALRFEHTLNTRLLNADVSYLVARGPARLPYFLPVLGETGPVLTPIYYGQWTAGLGIRAVPNASGWSRLTLKAEGAYKHPYDVVDNVGPTQDDYLQYTAGFDILVNPLFQERDQLLVTLEYAGEHWADDLASQLRPFDSDVALRLFWERQDFARTSVEIVSAVDVDNGELLLSATVGAQLRFVHDNIRLELSGTYLRPGSNGRGLLGAFTDNSVVTARLEVAL